MGELGYSVRVVCRLLGREGGWRALGEALSGRGWRVEGRRAWAEGVEAEVFTESQDGSEVVLSLRGEVGGEKLAMLIRSLIPPCWYTDIYYHFRGAGAEEAARRLGLGWSGNERRRVRVGGIELVAESYPSAASLTASYRVGAGEVGAVKKVHSRLIEGKRGILERLVGRG